MALQAESDWRTFFLSIGIPDTASQTYAKSFHDNRVNEELLPSLDKPLLTDLGITVIGDILKILNHIKQLTPRIKSALTTIPSTPQSKAPPAKLPEINSEMTRPQFRKFKIDWEVYKNISAMAPTI